MEIDRLKYYIAQRLNELSPINMYDSKPLGDMPYGVFKFYTCNYAVRHRKDWILEIDYWDDNTDDSTVLSAAIAVKNGDEEEEIIGLNNSTQDETEGFYQCTIEFEGEIPDTEQNISRYNQRYILKVD